MFVKKFAFPLFATLVLISLVSCGYSRWFYSIVEQDIERDAWEISFSIAAKGTYQPVSEGVDVSDEEYFYNIELTETDTTKFTRVYLKIANVRLISGDSSVTKVLSQKTQFSGPDQHTGATSVWHVYRFGPFFVGKVRPKSILVSQDISIYGRDTDEELTKFHHSVTATLSEGKYSYFKDFIKGT